MTDDRISIIIPTYNRPASLERILSYHHSHGFSGKIVVADSSSHHNSKMNSETISNLDENIDHEIFSEEVSVIKKIGDILKYIDTSYVVLNADDDFILPDGIKNAIRFLEQHDDFSAVHGNYIRFDAQKTKSGVTFDWSPKYINSRTLSHAKPRSRLHAHHSDYIPTFYAVHRTSSIQEGFERAVTAANEFPFGELLPSMTAMINGKFKHLNVFYGARYYHRQTKSTAEGLIDFILGETFTSKYDRYRSSLAGHLRSQSDLTYYESVAAVDDAMISYLTNYYPLSPGEATSLIKENRTPTKIAIKSTKSISFPVKIRDWLQTTSTPDQAISTLASFYIIYLVLMRSRDIERTKFYLQIDKPMTVSRKILNQIRHSVQSHPKALSE